MKLKDRELERVGGVSVIKCKIFNQIVLGLCSCACYRRSVFSGFSFGLIYILDRYQESDSHAVMIFTVVHLTHAGAY